ncbi:MAG: TetR/AcrR family transcriptional regulator [Nitrospirota bacterium]
MRKIRTKRERTVGRRPKSLKPDRGTRADILAAARHVFASRGIDGTSVREVAEAAKVNNAMIYYYFKDKEDLYRSVLSDSFSPLAAIWDDKIFKGAAPVKEKIRKYIEGYIRFQQVNEDLRRIMAMEFAGSGGNITWICEKHFAVNYGKLVKILKEGMKTGELKKVDPSLAIASLFGIIIHNFIMEPLAEHVHGKHVNLSPKKFGAFVTELFFNGLGRQTTVQRA